MPLPRMTTRRWMLAIAVVALLIWSGLLVRRSVQFHELSRRNKMLADAMNSVAMCHHRKLQNSENFIAEKAAQMAEGERKANESTREFRSFWKTYVSDLREMPDMEAMMLARHREDFARSSARFRDYRALEEKYRRAARSPWRSVPLDPPSP